MDHKGLTLKEEHRDNKDTTYSGIMDKSAPAWADIDIGYKWSIARTLERSHISK